MNLIDRDILVGRDGLFGQRGCPGRCTACNLWSEEGCRVILEAPTVDAKPVVHAKWLGHRGDLTCSNCGSEGPEDGGYWASPYCPSCGATMDLKEEAKDE